MPFYNKIPFIGKHLKLNDWIRQLTPTQISKLGEAYHQVIGLGNNPSFAANAFKKLDAQRAESNIKIAGETKGPIGTSMLEIAKHPERDPDAAEAARKVLDEVANALKPDKAYDNAMKEFNQNSATFKELVKKIPQGGFGAQDVISTMKFNVDKARAAAVTQHNLDKQVLTAKFDDPEFQKNLITAYSTRTTAQEKKPIDLTDKDVKDKIETIKNNMLKDLTSAHKKQLSEFDKATSESLNTLHKAAATEMQKMGVVDAIKRANSDNVAMLEILAEENRKKLGKTKDEPSGIKVHVDENKAKLSHVELADITLFKSMTGMEIKQPQPGTFSLYFPAMSPRYNQSIQQKPLTDLLFIAQAIKAQGFDKIDWTIEIGDQATLMERAKDAYKASVEAGISIDNISVRDGKGKPLKLEEIFEPGQLKELRQREANIKAELQGLNPPKAEAAEIKAVKETMDKIRAEHSANPPEEEEELDKDADKTATASGPK